VAVCTKHLYLQDRQLITPSTKVSWNDFEKGPASPNGHCRRFSAAPRQRASSHCAFNSRISGEEKHSRTSTSSLQPKSSSVRFIPLPKLKSKLKGHHFGTMENVKQMRDASISFIVSELSAARKEQLGN
jgi:hypothetical protein